VAAVTPGLGEAPITPFAPVVDCAELTTREINQAIRHLCDEGSADICVANPAARHNLAVALVTSSRILFEGPVGWYCAGMNDGAHVIVKGNCGWGVSECSMSGRVDIHGHAGSGAAASIRGGTVYVEGNAGARAGIAMKGGTLVVAGNVGYMSGFMMQRGTMIVGGDAADGLGDSMYEGIIYIAGSIESLGADAVEGEMTAEDRGTLKAALDEYDLGQSPDDFRKIEAGRQLWTFSTKEPELWRGAL
jgi:glutamate synthase domain-containing protein 3